MCVCQSAWVERKEKKKFRMKRKEKKKSGEKNEKELKNMRKRVPKSLLFKKGSKKLN